MGRLGAPVNAGTACADRVRAVTPNDSTNLPLGTATALWIGGAGDVAIIAEGDTSAVTIVAIPAGTILPIRTKRVLSTGTTATSIVALYN